MKHLKSRAVNHASLRLSDNNLEMDRSPGVDRVFHIAAQKGAQALWGADLTYTKNNVEATQQLLALYHS